MLALTIRKPPLPGRQTAIVMTDAYAVAGDVLTVERQRSVLQQPPGSFVTLEDPLNGRQTVVYRRAPQR